MDNQTAIGLLTLCAFVVVIVLLGALLLVRIMKSSIFGIANMVLRSVTDPVVEDTTSRVIDHQAVQQTGHRDLRAEAKAVDFDAAVAQVKGEAVPTVRTEPGTIPPPLNASAFSTSEPSTPGLVRRQRRRLRQEQLDDEDDGELFEGLLGE